MYAMKAFTNRSVFEKKGASGIFSSKALFCTVFALTATVAGAFPSPNISDVITAVTKGPLLH